MNRLIPILVCLLGVIPSLQSQCFCDNADNTCISLAVPFDCSNCVALCNFFALGAPVRSCPGLGSCLLPVKLTNFSVQLLEKSNQIQLQWSTASETNNQGFEVLRSIDGEAWQILNFIKGNGTSLIPQDYQFFDFPPISGTYYYRLKQIDHDEKVTYSDIQSIKYQLKVSSTNIFPNPVKDQIFIRTEYSTLTIYDRFGKALKFVNVQGQQMSIDLSDLNSGTYLVQFKGKNKKDLTRKILKL